MDKSNNNPITANASKHSSHRIVALFLQHLEDEYQISPDEIYSLIRKKGKIKEVNLPISIFTNTPLSALEIITKYLKENLSLRYHEIAVILNRDDRTIWSTYNKAKTKTKQKIKVLKSNITIPSSIFKNRQFGVLEALVKFLKEEISLSYHNIAVLLKKNDRTIWSSYNNSLKKSG